MSSTHLNRLVEEQNKLWNRMQEIQNRAEEESRDWTAEERQNWDAANERIEVVSSDIERLERAAKLDAVDYSQIIRAGSTIAETPEQSPEERAKAQSEAYERAFGSYMRHGMERLSGEQRQLLIENRDTQQVTVTNNLGGYLVPPGYRAVITEALKAYGGVLNLANVIHTSTGNNLQWPSHDGTAEKGRILAEAGTANPVQTTNITFGTKSLGAYTYSSDQVLVSLQDSAFPLDTYVPQRLGERLGRIVADHLVTGSGSSQPEGVLTNAQVGVTAAAAPSGSGGGPQITYDDIVDLEHSVDPAYRAMGRARFLFNDSTLAVLRKIKDTMGRPIWLPTPTPGFPSTINGVQYTIDQSMPAVASGNKSVLYGDFQAGYIVRQVLDMQFARLAERYAENLQVGYFAFLRLDARPDDANAIRALKHA